MRHMQKIVLALLVIGFSVTASAASWMDGLPTVPVTAKPLDKVWATVPEAGGDMAAVGIFEVDSVQGNTATLIDKIGTKYPNVPGALIHPVGDPKKLKINDIALGNSWGASKVIGRVKAIEAGKVTLRYKFGSNISEKQMDFAQPLVSGVNPMAWVVYRNNMNSPYKGLVIAKGNGKVWISTDSGHVEIAPIAKVRPLDMAPNGFKVGQTVYAYQWGFGYKPGTVKKIVEPYHQYEIKLADKPTTDVFIFSEVAAAVP
ncbi:MAG: hypothetical protein COV45_00775 [Deltaproteobacteria bacterium CG11_big_fil_rev_8_21_14_0_20_47_16]|nr:MAG: hypothetical protein COV45_00775 [Deltaproteobacteria bacterium CG11_big_fil_rev_8_21_14_0_20_47_16]